MALFFILRYRKVWQTESAKMLVPVFAILFFITLNLLYIRETVWSKKDQNCFFFFFKKEPGFFPFFLNKLPGFFDVLCHPD